MQSKIRIEFDFDTNQPVLRITQAKESDDLRDTMLKSFIQKATNHASHLYFTFPDFHDRRDNSVVELRCDVLDPKEPEYSVINNSDKFLEYLNLNGIEHRCSDGVTTIIGDINIFQLAFEFGKLYQKANP